MKICVVGTGYVGLVSGACLADVGNNVICVDRDADKVAALHEGIIPIYEPGLESVVRRNCRDKRLTFTTDLAKGLAGAEICFITVDTPPDGDGKADLTNVLAVAESIGSALDHPMVVVTKSTVPVGTTMKVKEKISTALQKRGLNADELLRVASNPEFLKEGDAVNDFMKPDRVVVGVEDEVVGQKLKLLYSPFMRRGDRFMQMRIESSELTKYAANAMLATRISFMNEMARLCEKVGADIGDVRHGLGSDPRIGPDFLYAGLGYGGSCFPKDTKAVIELGREVGERLSVIEAADFTNNLQREWFWKKISCAFASGGGLSGKRIAMWGAAFKANTDDVRFAPSIYLIEQLIEAGAKVRVFDPVARAKCREALGDNKHKVEWADDVYDCLENADALIVCTEWREFRSPDFKRMKARMEVPMIFDGRNLWSPGMLKDAGFEYSAVGRCG
jgi:UDPglucose 6-dehydrogenase